MASTTSTDNSTSTEVPLRSFSAATIRKICVLLLSFTAAVVFLSIVIVILAPIFIAMANRFPSLLETAGEGNPSREILYIPPTQDDLDQIRKDLEVSEILPAINIASEYSDNPRSASRILSVISITESQLQQFEREWKSAKKEVDDLTAAYNSFLERWEQDLSRNEMHVVDDGAAMQYFESRLTSLRTILGGERTTFLDLDRHDMTQLITTAIDELHWLLEAEDESEAAHKKLLYLNTNNMLLKLFAKSASNNNETEHTCHTSYLDLSMGSPSIEFASVSKSAKSNTAPSAITKDTARKSDLYILMEDIKSALSWKHDVENMSRPSFISDEDLDDIRSTIAPMVTLIEKMRRSSLANEKKVRDYWVERFETFVADIESLDGFGNTRDIDGDEEILCSSSSLVEGMMEEGLEAYQRRGDLRSVLEKVSLRAVQDASPEIADILRDELQNADVPEMDYSSDKRGTLTPPLTTTSSWKVGKKSIAYAMDGPWLRHGVVNWIDYFTDVVSGYNGECISAVSFPVASVQRLSLVVALQSIQIM